MYVRRQCVGLEPLHSFRICRLWLISLNWHSIIPRVVWFISALAFAQVPELLQPNDHYLPICALWEDKCEWWGTGKYFIWKSQKPHSVTIKCRRGWTAAVKRDCNQLVMGPCNSICISEHNAKGGAPGHQQQREQIATIPHNNNNNNWTSALCEMCSQYPLTITAHDRFLSSTGGIHSMGASIGATMSDCVSTAHCRLFGRACLRRSFVKGMDHGK